MEAQKSTYLKFLQKEWLYIAVVLLVTGLPRLCCLNLAEFKLDEANHYRMAYMLTRGAWRWTGSTASVGFPKPPLFVYVLALPAWLTRDPRVITGFLGALATFANVLFYLLLRRYVDRKAALGAALLFSLNPQAVLYGRKLFTADLIPPLAVLLLTAGIVFLDTPRPYIGYCAVAVMSAFALLILNTFSPIILAPAVLLLFWERRRSLTVRHSLLAGAAFGLPFIPYLIAVAPSFVAKLRAFEGGDAIASRPPLLRWIWTLLFGAPWPNALLSVAGVCAIILIVLTLVGLVVLIGRARDQKTGAWARFFLMWLVFTPLLMLLAPFEMQAHYLVTLYPLLFVLPAMTVDMLSRHSRALGGVGLFLILMVILWQGDVWMQILQDVAEGVEGYGTPLGYWWRAVAQAETLAEKHNALEIIIFAPGDQAWDEKGHVLDALLSGIPHRLVNGYTTVLYPPQRAIYLIASEVMPATALARPCTQNLEVTLAASPFGSSYHYHLWEPQITDPTACIDAFTSASAQWASGVELLGYGIRGEVAPGATPQLTLYWKAHQGPMDLNIHWFNHVLDIDGQRWGQFDGVGFPASRWHSGDRVTFQFELPIAADAPLGPYMLLVGQYTYPDMTNIPVVDAAGNALDAATTVSLETFSTSP